MDAEETGSTDELEVENNEDEDLDEAAGPEIASAISDEDGKGEETEAAEQPEILFDEDAKIPEPVLTMPETQDEEEDETEGKEKAEGETAAGESGEKAEGDKVEATEGAEPKQGESEQKVAKPEEEFMLAGTAGEQAADQTSQAPDAISEHKRGKF